MLPKLNKSERLNFRSCVALMWLEYFKLVFLEIQNVTIWSVLLNQVKYTYKLHYMLGMPTVRRSVKQKIIVKKPKEVDNKIIKGITMWRS